jgi:leader peptidase (prepilin peptidase)/N-methyltransferase
MEAILTISMFTAGTIIGSFLNVCAYRLPRDKSIVFPGSFCPACRQPIRFFDNVPIISYVILRGRCRSCASPISPRYPVVEAVTGLLFLLVYIKTGLSVELPVSLLFTSLLIVISLIDLEFQIIPDVLSIGGILAGFGLSFLRAGSTYLDALLGILLGGGILLAIALSYKFIAKREGMGGGDVKLLAMIGAFCGMKGVLFSLMSGSVLGTLVGIPVMLMKGEGTKYAIPFGPFLSLGALIYVFAGERIIDGFFGLLYG